MASLIEIIKDMSVEDLPSSPALEEHIKVLAQLRRRDARWRDTAQGDGFVSLH